MSSTLFVFIHPSEIIFSNDLNDTAQTISIYNPYDFTITFSFKSTRPNAFILSSTDGEIVSRHSLDVQVNLIDKTVIEEKFKITIQNGKKKILGEKIIKVICRTSFDDDRDRINNKSTTKGVQPNNDSFHDLDQPPCYSGLKLSKKYPEYKKSTYSEPNQYLVYLALAVCFIILMLPHEEIEESYLSYFQVSVNFKLVAAYVLGIVTVFLIRN